MGQRRLQVRNPGEKDRIALVVMIRLEDELVPVVQVRTIFEESVQARRIFVGTGIALPRNCNQWYRALEKHQF